MTLGHIAHLIPFPIAKARHGGQIRAREINAALRHAGFTVANIEVFDAGAYPSSAPVVDVSAPLYSGPWVKDWRLRDFAGGQALAQDDEAFGELVASLPSDLDLLVVEEPWLGMAALRLRREGYTRAPILFNSYNIEHIAKGHILRGADVEDADEHIAAVAELERELLKEASITTAVTESDARHYRQMVPCRVEVAPNGTTAKKRSHLVGVRHHGIDVTINYALFVGSAHPPNVAGFAELVMSSLGYLRSHERVVVAGSAAHGLYPLVEKARTPWQMRDRLCLLSEVSDFELDCLIENASMILLPITYGGGSNLKTAEALLSNKPIVATEQAFRGYESYRKAPGVSVANDAEEFGRAMRGSFDNCREYKRKGLEGLLWQQTLQPIVDAARQVVANRDASESHPVDRYPAYLY